VPQRLGVFGGTFDPPHLGHLNVARSARDTLSLDRVLLVVANDPWQKSPERIVTPARDRLAMVQALVEDDAGLEASDIEIRRGGPSFTVATLRELRAHHGDSELFLIIGRDLVDDLPSWHESSEIERLATIFVVERPGYSKDALGSWNTIIVPPTDTSSTELRERLRSRTTDSFSEIPHLSPAVVKVIQERGLYHRIGGNIQAVQTP